MGVPVNTFFLFYQILLFESIHGLPFASISSLPSLKTSETPLNEEFSPPACLSNLVNTENSVSASTIPEPSNNSHLYIGSPIGNTNYFITQNPSLFESSNGIPSPIVNSPASFNIQPNPVALTPGFDSSSSAIDLNIAPSLISTSASSSGSVFPIGHTGPAGQSLFEISNNDFKSDNLQRGFRDTISQEPCYSVTQQNLASLTSNCVSNFPSPIFPSMPLLPNTKPMFPCIEKPVDVTRPPTFNFVCSSEESCELSNGRESESFQNNLLCPQDNPNMLLALKLLNNRIAQKNNGEVNSAAQSNIYSESSEIITLTQPPTPVNNAISPFAEIKNYIDSTQILQCDRIQNQPNIQNKLPNSHINRLNNNLNKAKITQSNNIPSQISESDGNCEYANQNSNLNVIPKMVSNNGLVKSSPRNLKKNNNDDNRGCPQVETVSVQGNRPFTQNSNILSNYNECQPENNNNLGNKGSISFNSLARVINNNLNDNEYYSLNAQNNNNKGCPLLTSIPVYNKESLLNKQLRENNNVDLQETLPNNCENSINNNNLIHLNQNDQGCPQLLSIAQNNLYARKTNEACTNNQDCNCIQTPEPNDNLAQALKMVNRAKPANVPASTINILPFGEALLDGKPMCNNLVKVEPILCPAQLPTCTCSDLSNSNKFLTIQEISSMTFPASPLNSFSCSNSLEGSIPVQANIMLTSPFSPIQRQSASPIISNMAPSLINIAPSVPTISSITNTESPMSNPPFIITQEPSCNSNIQPMLTLLSRPNTMRPIVTPNFIPVQSLPQVTFVNNLPTSMSVTPSLSLTNDYISSISNLPSVCSLQSIPSYNLVATNLQQTNNLASTSLFPSLNNMVKSLTQNIISTLMSKTPSTGISLASLPAVNTFTSNRIVETSSINLPLCLDISNLSNYIVSTPLTSTGSSLPNIPVACNEYLPPIYSSPIIPITTFNTDLFCVESDSTFDCNPFPLSTTDAYYPEISFMMPPCSSSDCSCLSRPLFMPANSLPKSPSVIKINNTGREAKGFEQLLRNVMI